MKQVQQRSLFSLSFIPHNASYYFLNHLTALLEPPYLLIDKEGNSVFSVYPAVLLLFYFFKKEIYSKKNKLFLTIIGSALTINLFLILSNMGSGWTQFGSRYFFDVMPGIFLITLFVLKHVNKYILLTILLYGLLINFSGIFLYYH